MARGSMASQAWLIHGTTRPASPFAGDVIASRRSNGRKCAGRRCCFSDAQRECVASAIERTARAKEWTLLARNVRTNHVHLVIAADTAPEFVMNALKRWSTRRMRDAGLLGADERPWARHGSTRYLKTPESVERAIWYVDEMQDQPREHE